MQKPRLMAVLVVAVLLTALGFIYPPEENLRLGKDLRGGVTLVYTVQIDPGDDPRAVMSTLIEVLKRRVDPSGQLDIGFAVQGRDRLEITMPLPNERVKGLRRQYEAVLAELDVGSLTPSEFDALMRGTAEERAARIASVTAVDAKRGELLRTASDARETATQARAMLRDARAQGATPERIRELVAAAGEAEFKFGQAREACLASVLTAREVREALELSDYQVRKVDENTRQVVILPSERQRALTRIRELHPEASSKLDAVLAAHATYTSERESLDDPSDLVRLLRGAGVLEFRITVRGGAHPEEDRLRRELRDQGPAAVRSSEPPAVWLRLNRVEDWFESPQDGERLAANPAAFFSSRGFVVDEYNGTLYMLCWDKADSRLTRAEGDWSVAGASPGRTQMGKPAIDFRMNDAGAMLLGQLTSQHVGQPMAVVMDDEVYTAPTINDRIGKSGQIYGEFPPEEQIYLVQTLAAGSLQAKLSSEPISQVEVAPDFGADNLRLGVRAGMISIGVCAAFLLAYYFLFGAVAVVGLLSNVVLLVGVMAMNGWAFTLPGIAGVILTIAMAVDANVLVYERVREELTRGLDLKTAVRLGYSKAFSAIIDGNLTNLIVCVVLISVGTQEIKGFAITMSVGVLTTLFAQLLVTRVIFTFLVDTGLWTRATMLPLAVPAVQRALTLNVDWMRLRVPFYVASAALMGLAAVMVFVRGDKMLDTEFVGGTAVTLRLKAGPDGSPMVMTRQEVEDRLDAQAEAATDEQIRQLRNADIQVRNPLDDGVSASDFSVKTLATNVSAVREAMAAAFGDVIDAQPAVSFKGSDAPDGRSAPAYPITDRVLGKSLDRPELTMDVADAFGGVAFYLDDISPAVSAASLNARLEQERGRPEYADIASRRHKLIVVEGTDAAVEAAVVVVHDPALQFAENQDRWSTQLRDREWQLVTSSLSQNTTLLGVQSFNPVIARTFVAQAIVAVALSTLLVVVYVWVRFNSIRYSVAAVLPTIHDCLAVVGLLAAGEIVYDSMPVLAQSLGILAFKLDLTVVAAILTVLGYSINDKIVVLDRIRENRGRLTHASREIINQSINQTLSRTLMTGTTTILATFVLYLIGGEAVRSFSFSLGLGVIIGTASSISLGAPLVWSKHAAPPAPRATEKAAGSA